MPKKVCIDCHQVFVVEKAKAWAVRCYPCWEARNDQQDRRRLKQLEQQVIYWREQAEQARCNPLPTPGPIPPDMLQRMLMLCHPDRHHNSEMSTKTTQWLLQQREQ